MLIGAKYAKSKYSIIKFNENLYSLAPILDATAEIV